MADASHTDTTAHATTVEKAAENDASSLGQHTETGGHASAGLPQFQFEHWPGQVAYLLILFAILYVLMSRVFTPRIRKIFDEREATISGALASARQVQTEAAAQAEEARQALAQSRASAQKTAADTKAKADAEAKARQAEVDAQLAAKVSEAEVGIRAARDAAMASVSAVAVDAAQGIIEKLTGTPAPPEQVNAALATLQR